MVDTRHGPQTTTGSLAYSVEGQYPVYAPSGGPVITARNSNEAPNVLQVVYVLFLLFVLVLNGGQSPIFAKFRYVNESTRYLNALTINFKIVCRGDFTQVRIYVVGRSPRGLFDKLCRFRFVQRMRLFGVIFCARTPVQGHVLAYPLPVCLINVTRRVSRVFLTRFRWRVGLGA